MGSNDPRTWARKARTHRLIGFVLLAVAIGGFFVAGLAPALCLIVISWAYLLSARSVEETGHVSTPTRILIILAWGALIELLLTAHYRW